MRKKHLYCTTRRFIAILMTVIMLCLSPLSDLQMNSAYASSSSAEEIEAENAAPGEMGPDFSESVPYSPLVGELEEHRDRNTKTFLREDGAKEMVVYSYAVHYEDDGQWKDIDNSLYPVKLSDGSVAYTNVANDYRVWFSEGSDGDYLVKIEKGGYSISWTIPEMTSAAEALVDEDSISDIGTLADGQMVSTPGDVDIRLMTDGQLTTEEMSTMTDEERDNALKFPSSYSSVIAYESAVNGLDVRYVVRPQMIEEFFEASTAAVAASLGEVELVISCEGVTAQKSADGSVMFVNPSGEQVFSLGQPYMSDASGAVSADIDVSLTPAETAWTGNLSAGEEAGMLGAVETGAVAAEETETAQYIYQLTPSKEWLESEERTYPVSVDPNIYTSVFCDDIQDASVYEQGPDFPFGTWPESLRVGWRNGGDTYRTYIKFNTLPAIEAGNVILSAHLQLFRFWDPELWNHYDYGSAVEAYAVNAAWAEDTITWNNQPSCGPEVEAIVFCHPLETEGKRYQSFDLTSLVKRWYSGTPNYGISLRSAKEDEQYFYEYYYSEAEYAPENHPHLSIVYANAEGIEPMWSYHSFAVNRAGVGYVNDYTGSLTIIDENVSVLGGALPISISHVYNSNNRNVDVGYGLGWRLSLMEEVSSISVNGVTWYRYLDGDGTEHYYYPSGTSGVYLDEMNSKNKLTVGSSGYTLVNSSFITRTFNSDGYLTGVSDPNGNAMTIELVGNWPVTVIDSAGRRTTLDYSSNRLAHIYYPDGSKADCYYTGSY
ncbi:MAG: DNRLRE domain-containing protein, partial [Lachnospiraceae bacterium]|nr:DNRLRE domain-containing protein [Lachnospiraceae bacterium]